MRKFRRLTCCLITEVERMYKSFFKRFIDIVLSFFGIVILGIPMLVLALIIKLTSPGPVLFKQKRVGLNKTHFNLLKFRTMRTDTPHDMPTHMLANPDQYITRIGRFLRKSSLDELPQIFNIFVGERGIIETTKNNADFSRVVTVNSISL